MPPTASPRSRILVVEDEPSYVEILTGNLEIEGYEVATAMDGDPALALHLAHPADLIILDLMLPSMDGFQFLQALRSRGDQVPVLMLTARGEERAKVRGFELGVDDYVTKPFSILELLSRVRAILRRVHKAPLSSGPRVLASGPFVLDRDRLTLAREGEVLDIGDQGFRLLEILFLRPGLVVRRTELLKLAWTEESRPGPRTVDAHISLIRKCLGPEKAWLATVGGAGYRWLEPVAPT
jgi:DNA-binding response OmpR family regulator